MFFRSGLSFFLLAAALGCASGGATPTIYDAPIEEELPDARPPADARVRDAAGVADAPGTADAAGGKPDAPAGAPDAAVTGGVTLSPASVLVARGGTAALTVTIDAPAPAGGAAVTLESDSPAVTLPTSVTISAGATSATFPVTGIAVGDPVAVRARRGVAVSQISVRVVPALVSVTPGVVNVFPGDQATYTVNLEAAVAGAPVPVSLSLGNPAMGQVAASVSVAAGSSSATFTVTGRVPLGVTTVDAAIGDAEVGARLRVYGLLLSEILYDISGTDDMREWIELYNATKVPIDTAGMTIQAAGTSAGPSFVDALALTGIVPPGGCVVVGGPLGNDIDAGPHFTYFVAADFNPDLGNAGTSGTDKGDGIQLRAPGGVIDNVIYGRNNLDNIPDENGAVPAVPDIGDSPENRSMERTEASIDGPWVIDIAPNPGDCAAIAK